jgi:hypothetical protein
LPVSISDHLGVSATRFDKTGAFDAVLDVDSKLFIDPHLLPASDAPELSASYNKIKKLFSDLLKLLARSQKEGDPFWRAAFEKFNFPELQGICIGYSSHSTRGSGMGQRLRIKVLRTAKEIVDAGISDPEFFELVGLFEERIGPDRISDMVGRIIVDDLRKYTERILTMLKAKTVPVAKTGHKSILNPFNGLPLILVPTDVLRDLPIAEEWSEIELVCEFNQALRRKVNALIGDTWKTATSVKKETLRHVIVSEPEVLRDLVELYKKKPANPYDFLNDRSGEFLWLRASRRYVEDFPLKIRLPVKPSAGDLLNIVNSICDKFKDLVENNALSSLLYEHSGKPKKEEAAQKLFYGIADSYCAANDLDLSREANAGRGPVDFKVSKGYSGRVVVEAKLTTNKQLLHGFETQIGEYQKAEKAKTAIYLVIDVTGGSESQVTKLKKLIASSRADGLKVPHVIFVDAIPKLSASKYVPKGSA